MAAVEDEVRLFYKKGTSDKVYNVWLEKCSRNAYMVNFSYGRRGNSLTYGTKTDVSVDYTQAINIRDKLVSEKIKTKGYSVVSGSAKPISRAASLDSKDQPFNAAPQLLNMITEDQVKACLTSDDWWMMEKKDGKRLKVRREKGKNTAGNKRDVTVPFPEEVSNDITALEHDELLLDGELVGDKYYLFDLIKIDGQDLTDKPFYYRYNDLETFSRVVEEKKLEHLEVLPIYANTKQKKEAYERIKANRSEGVVFIKKDSSYTPGRPNSGGTRLKYKFVATATCKVLGKTEGKRSIQIGLRNEREIVPFGNVTIPPNHNVPEKDDFVEIRYLCAYEGGALREPVYLGTRDDQNSADDISTLKYKQENADEEEL